ncbi:TPA: helix-turn-helix transcriptional regulator [Serratia fonticola]
MSERVLREKATGEKIGVGRDVLRLLWKSGQFPAPFEITGRRALGWREADVDEWIVKQSKAKKRAAVTVIRHGQNEQTLSMTDAVSLLSEPLIGSEN